MNVTIIKVGGMLLNSNTAMIRLFDELFSYYSLFNQNILIIHGGNYWVKMIMGKVNYLIKKNNSLCIFEYDSNNIDNDLKIGILSGTINKYIINRSKICHIDAVGLSLTDGNTLILNELKNNNIIDPIFGSSKLIKYCFSDNIVPIISPIGTTKNNILKIVSSDYAAMSLVKFFKARLILLTDVSSVLDGKGNRIKILSKFDVDKLILEGIITGGMIKKVDVAVRCANFLNKPVDISGWQDLNKFRLLLNGHATATRIFPNN